MVQGIAFKIACQGDVEETHWTLLPKPPYLRAFGGRLFVRVPKSGYSGKLFVNGYPVLGMQAVDTGDWVRLVKRDGESTVYRVAARASAVMAEGHGRPCAFTGLPIRGEAVCCLACGRLYSPATAEQIEVCMCGTLLKPDVAPAVPEEELL
jgi:hypothetical protein